MHPRKSTTSRRRNSVGRLHRFGEPAECDDHRLRPQEADIWWPELATGAVRDLGRPLGQFRCGDRVWLCVRPDKLRSATAAYSHMNVLTARPVHTTFQGDRIEVRFTVSGVQNAAAASPAFLFYARSARDLADEMSICFDPDAAIFLGAAVP